MGLDDTGFETLFRRYHASIVAFFRGRGFSAETAADLTQDVFERVYRAREGYRGDAERSWIVQIAKNVWKNELRRRMAQKRDVREVSLDAAAGGDDDAPPRPEPAAHGDDPEIAVLARERRGRLLDALTRLPPQARRCATLRYQQGLKYREIAATLDLSVGTVKSHLAQAKERLRSEVEGEAAVGGRAGGGR